MSEIVEIAYHTIAAVGMEIVSSGEYRDVDQQLQESPFLALTPCDYQPIFFPNDARTVFLDHYM